MEEPNDVVGDRLLRDLLVPRNNSSNVTFSVNAGGGAFWTMVGLAAFMFMTNVWLGFMYLDTRRSLQRVEDYQQTTFMLVPELRKQIEQTLNERKGREQ